MEAQSSRREFFRHATAATVAGAALVDLAGAQSGAAPVKAPSGGIAQTPTSTGGIPQRDFGKTGVKVSILGLGGHALGLCKVESEAVRIVHEAIDAGLTFMDNAHEYHDGRSEEWMGKALTGRRDKAFVMTKVCTHGRNAKKGMEQLEESLRRLQTDYVDLWQVHEVVYENDPELHFAPGGVIEALDQAKQQGKIRYTGFTGHKHPDIHLRMLAHDYPFDAVQMPLNAFDASFRSFEKLVLPELHRRKIAPIAMKSLGGTGESINKGAITVDDALRYVLSLPVATLVSGIDSLGVLQQNLRIVRDFQPMSEGEMADLRKRCSVLAADGRFELYKTSAHFEGPPGREQHGFPAKCELES